MSKKKPKKRANPSMNWAEGLVWAGLPLSAIKLFACLRQFASRDRKTGHWVAWPGTPIQRAATGGDGRTHKNAIDRLVVEELITPVKARRRGKVTYWKLADTIPNRLWEKMEDALERIGKSAVYKLYWVNGECLYLAVGLRGQVQAALNGWTPTANQLASGTWPTVEKVVRAAQPTHEQEIEAWWWVREREDYQAVHKYLGTNYQDISKLPNYAPAVRIKIARRFRELEGAGRPAKITHDVEGYLRSAFDDAEHYLLDELCKECGEMEPAKVFEDEDLDDVLDFLCKEVEEK